MTADSKTSPLSLGTFRPSLPALAVRLRSICMMLEGLADFVASAPSRFLHSLAALSRSAAADTHVPRAMAVLWSSYAR